MKGWTWWSWRSFLTSVILGKLLASLQMFQLDLILSFSPVNNFSVPEILSSAVPIFAQSLFSFDWSSGQHWDEAAMSGCPCLCFHSSILLILSSSAVVSPLPAPINNSQALGTLRPCSPVLGLPCFPGVHGSTQNLCTWQRVNENEYFLPPKGTFLNVRVAVFFTWTFFYFPSVRQGHDIAFCPVEILNKNKAIFILISSFSEYQGKVH